MTNSTLRSIVDRILRLKEEQDALTDDIKEIYAEAKSGGYDKARLGEVVMILRRKAKDPAAFAERQAILEAYLAELGEEAPHTPAPARVVIPAAPVKAAAEHREPPAADASPSHEEDEAGRKAGLSDGSRHIIADEPSPKVLDGRSQSQGKQAPSDVSRDDAGQNLAGNSWQMAEDLPPYLDRRSPAVAIT